MKELRVSMLVTSVIDTDLSPSFLADKSIPRFEHGHTSSTLNAHDHDLRLGLTTRPSDRGIIQARRCKHSKLQIESQTAERQRRIHTYLLLPDWACQIGLGIG
jgi:hypothetical protein